MNLFLDIGLDVTYLVFSGMLGPGDVDYRTHFGYLEAEAYHGPSLVICYAPCINRGI